MKKKFCDITKKELPSSDLVAANTLRPQLFSLIKSEHPDFSEDKFISKQSLENYRKKYLENIITKEIGELGKLEKEVIKAVDSDQLLAENINIELETELTTGQRLADKIAEFGGSWSFIIFFFSFILIWMVINIFILAAKPFDPYPFILLNLLLSCLAAIQAPIIMMSQNRKEQKDRARSEHDYKINLKAELEIRLLHEKLDHLMIHQNKHLLEIQEIQLDYLEEIAAKKKSHKKTEE